MTTHMVESMYLVCLILPVLSFAFDTPCCNNNPYGRPGLEACASLLATFADSRDAQPRIFDEEQLRSSSTGSWPGIRNPFPREVIQIPKYWSRGERSFTEKGKQGRQSGY